MSDKAIQLLSVILLQAIILSAGCGNQSAETTEDGRTEVVTRDSRQAGSSLTSEKSQGKSIQNTLLETAKKEPPQEQSLVEVDWGREVDLDEMIAMAREDRIREIQWHVMPNILRAEALDGGVFHIRNENKGVDLRNALMNEGIRLGKGGVLFRHVF